MISDFFRDASSWNADIVSELELLRTCFANVTGDLESWLGSSAVGHGGESVCSCPRRRYPGDFLVSSSRFSIFPQPIFSKASQRSSSTGEIANDLSSFGSGHAFRMTGLVHPRSGGLLHELQF
ncbi:hypothetical protein KM043_004004 [Ampulex compressa]|nr:hypothetical protein KM043_004004 [Ampulex compressa]